APFTVNDNKVTVTCPASPTSIAPNGTITCTASYNVTQADLDAGSITNVATGHAKFGQTTIDSNQDQVTVTAVQTKTLSLKKSANVSTYSTLGQTINYSYLLKNTGNVTLSAPFTVNDNKVTVTCPASPTSIAPNGTITCAASYNVTQADLDAGSITNVATGHAKFGQTTVDSNQDQATVTAVQTKALSLKKSANVSTYSTLGQTINYSYLLKNTGNVT